MTNYKPEGYTSVAPWVVTDDTGAFLDFVTSAFGGVELARVAVEDGSIGHGEIRVGDTVVLAFDRRPGWPSMPSLLRVFVPDADAAMARAVEAGARVVTDAATNAGSSPKVRVLIVSAVCGMLTSIRGARSTLTPNGFRNWAVF